MYNIGFLLSFVAPVQLLFPLLNSNLTEKIVVNHYDLTFNNGICNIEGGQYNVVSVVPIGIAYTCGLYVTNLSPVTYAVKIRENETYSGTFTCRIVYVK